MTAPQMPMPVVGRHQRHQECRDAHEQQGRDERGFAADAVAIVAEDRGTYRPRDKAHRIDAKSLQGADERVRLREEQLREHRPVIVP